MIVLAHHMHWGQSYNYIVNFHPYSLVLSPFPPSPGPSWPTVMFSWSSSSQTRASPLMASLPCIPVSPEGILFSQDHVCTHYPQSHGSSQPRPRPANPSPRQLQRHRLPQPPPQLHADAHQPIPTSQPDLQVADQNQVGPIQYVQVREEYHIFCIKQYNSQSGLCMKMQAMHITVEYRKTFHALEATYFV